jgi:murein DD-endopeptidase MepM/ murein hydrolase activator NlpD
MEDRVERESQPGVTRPLPPPVDGNATTHRRVLFGLAATGPLVALILFLLWNLGSIPALAPELQMTPTAPVPIMAVPLATPTEAIVAEAVPTAPKATQLVAPTALALHPLPSPTATAVSSRLPLDSVLVSVTNTLVLRLMGEPGWPIVHPIALAVADNQLFLIDSGRVYAAQMPAQLTPNATLGLQRLLAPDDMIETLPVKEPVDLAVSSESPSSVVNEKTLFVLDKSNDVYRLDLATGTWSIEEATISYSTEPDPHTISLASYAGRLYLLDTARDNVWRRPADTSRPANYLPTTWKPWDLEPGWPDVTHGIDLAVDGDVYVLTWEGTIKKFSGAPPVEQAGFAAWLEDQAPPPGGNPELEARLKPEMPYVVPSRGPLALATTTEISELYVLDPDAGQVLVLGKLTGEHRQTLALQLPSAIGPVSALAVTGQMGDHGGSPLLYLAAGDRLYVYPGGPSTSPAPPTLAAVTGPSGPVRPNDPRVLGLLSEAKHPGFQLPLAGVPLGDRAAVYPGARRAYRYGVHEGHDFYSDAKHGITVTVGTPVLAAQDGRVIRADLSYRELTPHEYEALIEASRSAHATSSEDKDRLRGRQVWINHGDGIVTRYAHLSSIAEGIITGTLVARGQVIGFVGLSGTADGVYQQGGQFAHLHFEIRIGDYYLGQWLSVPETMRWWWRVFENETRQR